MSKAILMSIRPKWVAKILNGEKTVEIRKRFPSDYVGWVYIYCTKEQGLARLNNGSWNDTFVCEKNITNNEFKRMYSGYDGNGKVVARFWCDKDEEYISGGNWTRYKQDNGVLDLADYLNDDVLRKSCLTENDLYDYCKDLSFKAIYITKLEIFDKPKELNEFKLTKAPQSWFYVEIKETESRE